MSEWILTLRSPLELDEAIGAVLREAGTSGIWEVSAREWRAYFPSRDASVEEHLRRVTESLDMAWSPDEPEDWAARYQASLRPIPMGRRFVILPAPELTSPWPKRIPLRLVPGMAFGTGEHFTTASCLRVLEGVRPVPPSVLDVGCGTGILAAAAWKLGARKVIACDTDPEACAVSRETAAVNGTPFDVVEGSADAVLGTYDLLFANILAETLVEIFPHLSDRIAPGGHLVGSGILLSLGDAVLEASVRNGLSLFQRRTDGEWWTFLWRR